MQLDQATPGQRSAASEPERVEVLALAFDLPALIDDNFSLRR